MHMCSLFSRQNICQQISIFDFPWMNLSLSPNVHSSLFLFFFSSLFENWLHTGEEKSWNHRGIFVSIPTVLCPPKTQTYKRQLLTKTRTQSLSTWPFKIYGLSICPTVHLKYIQAFLGALKFKTGLKQTTVFKNFDSKTNLIRAGQSKKKKGIPAWRENASRRFIYLSPFYSQKRIKVRIGRVSIFLSPSIRGSKAI